MKYAEYTNRNPTHSDTEIFKNLTSGKNNTKFAYPLLEMFYRESFDRFNEKNQRRKEYFKKQTGKTQRGKL